MLSAVWGSAGLWRSVKSEYQAKVWITGDPCGAGLEVCVWICLRLSDSAGARAAAEWQILSWRLLRAWAAAGKYQSHWGLVSISVHLCLCYVHTEPFKPSLQAKSVLWSHHKVQGPYRLIPDLGSATRRARSRDGMERWKREPSRSVFPRLAVPEEDGICFPRAQSSRRWLPSSPSSTEQQTWTSHATAGAGALAVAAQVHTGKVLLASEYCKCFIFLRALVNNKNFKSTFPYEHLNVYLP